MKYFTEEITTLKDGTTAQAIWDKASKKEAISAFHQILASAYINDNVSVCHVEAKNNVGGIYKTDTYVDETEEPVVPEEPLS